MNISIFAKKQFRNKRDGHLMRVSSMIRGEQIANQIGARLNPESDYQNDVCIYVKPHVKRGDDFNFEGKAYLDIVDATDLYPLAQKHPEIGVIAVSEWDFETMSKVLPNKIFFIPQHHCNFERFKRNRQQITTVGVIGTAEAFAFLPQGLKEELQKRNVELIEFSKFFTRQDIVNFYQKIDVQIIWRPYFDYRKNVLMNPLKMVNASSFGIPTIAYKEGAFKEMEGYYFPVNTLEEFLSKLDILRSDSNLYTEYSQKCLEKSEEYHIENIGKLYKNLCTI